MQNKTKWTFMVYLAGDNNLSEAGDKDLGEMRAVGSTADVNVVAEFDNAGDAGTVRYHIQRDGESEEVVSLGETDSGSPEVLLDFIGWAAESYPAERYGLVLWNHGGGWEPSEMDRVAAEVKASNYNVREATERSSSPLGKVFFRPTLRTIFNLQSPQLRAICSDDGSGHSLDTVELGKVLAEAQDKLGQPLDLLGMDACLMSNFEVAYQARRYANYVVASEESEPNDGWPYDAVVRRLVEEPELPTAVLAAHIVEAYVQSYADRNYPGPITQAALDLSAIDVAASSLDALAAALIGHMPAAAEEIWSAQRQSARFWHNTLWDVGHFCEELEGLTADEAVRDAAAGVRASFGAGAGNFVVAESHYGDTVERCAGVSIYLMPPLMAISQYYDDLAYVKEHKRWLEMMQAYHAV